MRLTIVVAAQFMFEVDVFIVKVAISAIATELQASAAPIEAVIAIYLVACATLVITGGRLGDIHGTKNVSLAGVLGFTVTSLWCGLAQSGPGAGMYGTTAQIASAAGVAAIGAAFFAIEAAHSARLALFAAAALFALSIAACGAFLSWMRHAAA